METIIHGASDDLIEIEGGIREEFNFYPDDEDDTRYLCFSDGTLLSVNYDKDGIWRFVQMAKGEAEYKKVEGLAEENDNSDLVKLRGADIRWVALATECTLKRGLKKSA